MRWKNAALTIAVVTVFCGYLLSTSEHQSPTGATRNAPPAILLSQPTHANELVAAPGPERLLDGAAGQDLSLPMPPPPPGVEAVREASSLEVEETAGKHRSAWALVTAYCPCRRCCGRFANGRTSTGTSAWKRGGAADPTALRYGTRVFVPGYGYTSIDDTGGAMRRVWRRKGMLHIDVRMTWHWQARQWGRKLLKVRIYDVE